MKNIITNSDDQKLIHENGNIDLPTKEVCYHHNCGLEFTYQVSNQNPRTLPFSMMPTSTHFHIFKHMSLVSQPESIIISLQGKLQNSTDRDIGNIDKILSPWTLFSKIQGHFRDWIKTCYYRKKWVLWYPKLVWIKKWCHLFFKAIWILLMMIAPYCRKQLGLSASSSWLWKAPVLASLSCVATSSGGAEASFVFLFWYTTPIQSCMACRPAAMELVSLS